MQNSPYIEVIPFPLCGFGFLRRLGVQFGSCSNGLFFFCYTSYELEIRSEDSIEVEAEWFGADIL